MMDGKSRIERSAIVRAFLTSQFPNCFRPNDQPKKPLKIDIDCDIRQAFPQISRRDLSRALRFYTTRPSYVLALIEGQLRYDLSGNVSGVVDPQHAERAKEMAQNYNESVKEKWRKRTEHLNSDEAVQAA